MGADSGKIIGAPFTIGDRVETNIYDPENQLVASSRHFLRLSDFSVFEAFQCFRWVAERSGCLG
jgi:hypothetical protein